MKALVTGSEGFVGRHLVPKLKEQGYEVIEVDIKKGMSFQYWKLTFAERVDLFVNLAANIKDVDARSKAGIEVYEDLLLDYEACDYAQRYLPKTFVAMSSCATDYPDDSYGWIKLTLEKFCQRLKGVDTVILRPFSGYGSDQALSYPFPAILKRAMEKQDPLTVWGSGLQVRDWVHIDDLIDGMLWAIKDGPRGVPIEIGTGDGVDFIQLARMMAEEVGYSPKIFADARKAEASHYRVANANVTSRLGWTAKIRLREGIQRSITELR